MPTLTIELFWDDLTEKAKSEITTKMEEVGMNTAHNWDVFPLATVCMDIDTE